MYGTVGIRNIPLNKFLSLRYGYLHRAPFSRSQINYLEYCYLLSKMRVTLYNIIASFSWKSVPIIPIGSRVLLTAFKH